jgi:hypothetical protein
VCECVCEVSITRERATGGAPGSPRMGGRIESCVCAGAGDVCLCVCLCGVSPGPPPAGPEGALWLLLEMDEGVGKLPLGHGEVRGQHSKAAGRCEARKGCSRVWNLEGGWLLKGPRCLVEAAEGYCG